MKEGAKMVVMPNAPLRYTLAMMRFPKVLNIEKFAGFFQEEVRSEYALISEQNNQGFQMTIGDNGAEVQAISEKIWQFSDINRGHALILGQEFLVIHAGKKYNGHNDFISRFSKAVAAFLRVGNISAVMTSIGYRYIDLVVPDAHKGEKLGDYLQPWAMPTADFNMAEGVSLVDSVYVAGFRTPLGILRFQSLRRPPNTLPPELATTFVKENGWVEPRPEGEFALLDFDHAENFSTPLAIDPAEIVAKLEALRVPAVQLFYGAVTPHALENWRREI
jgi:uncharacterized protein (TIGR04255 family)